MKLRTYRVSREETHSVEVEVSAPENATPEEIISRAKEMYEENLSLIDSSEWTVEESDEYEVTHEYIVSIPEVWVRSVKVSSYRPLSDSEAQDKAENLLLTGEDPFLFEFSRTLNRDVWEVE